MTLLLEVDAFFLNEDRHFHNIAVIYNDKTEEFRYCPIFDNGGALFSDTSISFPVEKNIEECHSIIAAKLNRVREILIEQMNKYKHLSQIDIRKK